METKIIASLYLLFVIKGLTQCAAIVESDEEHSSNGNNLELSEDKIMNLLKKTTKQDLKCKNQVNDADFSILDAGVRLKGVLSEARDYVQMWKLQNHQTVKVVPFDGNVKDCS
ncbi:unnamed protein product [Adineta ricciae]|uniref:Uncharacterized protein n=1 Tax=Adineta ricciae TaxID=249248 RepID=A0A816HLA0_ADIRI|nr:unnamed protein product [Adineta ricciae]